MSPQPLPRVCSKLVKEIRGELVGVHLVLFFQGLLLIRVHLFVVLRQLRGHPAPFLLLLALNRNHVLACGVRLAVLHDVVPPALTCLVGVFGALLQLDFLDLLSFLARRAFVCGAIDVAVLPWQQKCR